MFDLDTAVARWRNEIALSGRLSRDEVDELEDHLRAAFQDEVAGGLDPKDAFQFASSDLGAIAELTEEFSKVRTNTWRRVLVAGFALFAVSFALPVTSSGISLLGKPLDLGTIPGIEAFWYAITGELGLVGWFSALTNLLVAPALWKPSRRDRKGITVTAGVIVAATFLNLYWLTDGASGLMIGYFAWLASFAVMSAGLLMRAKELSEREPIVSFGSR